MSETRISEVIEPGHFRRVLGQYPTGVCVITSLDTEGQPVGMTVGSLTSLSLDPPLVAFSPMKGSRTFGEIAATGRFAVNILAGDQVAVCRRFASRETDKFGPFDWRPSRLGSPILDGVVAWIDCRLDTVYETGDHLMVIGAVDNLETERPAAPLMFFQGGYGRFSALSMIADAEDAIAAHLRLADLARPHLQRLSSTFKVPTAASALAGEQVIQVAWADANDTGSTTNIAGLRLPFVAPFGLLFAAWEIEAVRENWLNAHAASADDFAGVRQVFLDELARARSQGWTATPDHAKLRSIETSIARIAAEGQLPEAIRELDTQIADFARAYATLTDTPPRQLAVPVFDHSGRVSLVLTAHSLPSLNRDALNQCRAELTAAGHELTHAINGVPPQR
ncbi:flavin reductase [Streptomyces sp. NEAU-YJ-81]|uniref:flavin reductase n=1 Tax=Streptomyces sp. NEAU-YJ-81 TaxID=2820288 RepID=UPI001ABC75BE|nr:flavin reductase [Streptomyces sp. NEAU-YJ-81]MBO3682507.1 flavin reductase [Streptomyces sp. NEAU-YJ-81]